MAQGESVLVLLRARDEKKKKKKKTPRCLWKWTEEEEEKETAFMDSRLFYSPASSNKFERRRKKRKFLSVRITVWILYNCFWWLTCKRKK